MVGIVVDHDQLGGLDAIVETAAHALISSEAIAQLMLVNTQRHDNGSSGNSVFDVVEAAVRQFEVVYDPMGCTEVEIDVAIVVTDIPGVVVGLDALSRIGIYSVSGEVMGVCGMRVVMMVLLLFGIIVAYQGQSLFNNEETLRVGLRGELLEGFEEVLACAIDVKMVGIGGRDDATKGMELKEGAVVLVGLNNHVLAAVVDQDVGIEIFGYAA